MNKRRNKFISLIMAFTMFVSVVQTTFALDNVSDIQGHWAQESVTSLVDAGIIGGYGDGTIRPNNFITRAEMAKVLNKVFGYTEKAINQFGDVAENAWYAEELLIARGAGYYGGFEGNLAKPNEEITRQDATAMIARVFDIHSTSGTSGKFKDANKIAVYSKQAVDGLVDQQVIGGYADNTFRPGNKITRAEVSKIINMLSGEIYNIAGTYTEELPIDRAVINVAGVTLKDVMIEEDLYLTEGIGSGDVVLENVIVKGRVTIAGGGINSVKLINCTLNEVIVTAKKPVRIISEGRKVSIKIKEGVQATLAGIFNTVEVSKGAKVDTKEAAIDKLILMDDVGKEIINVVEKPKGGTGSGGSGDSGGTTQPPKEDEVLKKFTFESTTEGFQNAGMWQAEFGTPDVEWSNDLGDGALKANVVFKGDQSWSEIKLKNTNVPELEKANNISYELFFDLSAEGLDKNMNKAIDPHLGVEGDIKIGQGFDKKTLSEFEKVTLGGKEYAKYKVEIIVEEGKLDGKQELWIMVVCSNLPYTGPIYIDNVKLIKSDIEDKDWGPPGVLPINNREKISVEEFDLSSVNLVDGNATAETISLYGYMKNVATTNMLFGHQNTNSQGVTIKNTDGTHSDVKNSVDAYPAIYGWDTLALVGNEGTYEELVKWSNAAIQEGAIITISAHMPNFTKVKKANGKYDFQNAPGSNDSEGKVVTSILQEGSEANKAFLAYLDIFAKYAKEIKDTNGKPYPILFRPWHENSGSWFWWGVAHCTTEEYIQLYRYTVEYLRDVKDVHNLLYVYSPNGHFVDEAEYLSRYPGDEYIDIIGFDMYHDNPVPGDGWIEKTVKDCEIVVDIANARGKVAAISETGVRHDPDYGIHPTNNKYKNWYTDFTKAIKENNKAKQVAFMLVWRNGNRDHCWVPFRNHPTFGHHEMLDDFISFYNDDFLVFADRLTDVYNLDVKTEAKEPYAYIVTPHDKEKISGDYTVRAKVFNYGEEIEEVKISTEKQEITMALTTNNTYIGVIDTLKEINDNNLPITLTVRLKNGTTLKDTVISKVYNLEILIKEYTFDSAIEGLQHDGIYEDSDSRIIVSGSIYQVDGMAGIDVTIMDDSQNDTNWTWQELKFKLSLKDTQGFESVNYVFYEMFFKQEYTTDSAIQLTTASAITTKLAFNKDNYDEVGTDDAGMDDWEEVRINGEDYYKVRFSFDITDMAQASDMLFSFIGRDLNYNGPVFVDNIRFYNKIKEVIQDPKLVDDFEGYEGDVAALRANYVRNSGGGIIGLSLDQQGDNTRLKYDYELSPGYAGVIKNLGGVDWNDCDQLEVVAHTDNQGGSLIFQITAGGSEYEYRTVMNEVKGEKMIISFNDIHRKGSTTPLMGRAGYVTHFAIYVNAPNNQASDIEGTLYFDDIKVSSSGNAPNEPPAEESLDGYDFEAGLQGWTVVKESNDDWSKKYIDCILSSEWSASGQQSAKGNFQFAEGYSFYMLTNDCESLEGKSSITATVKATENGKVKAKLYLKTGDGWSWFDAGMAHIEVLETGSEIFIPLEGLTSPVNVKEIGIQFIPDNDPIASCVLYVDKVTIE